MFEKEKNSFICILITTNNHKESNLFDRDTFFYRFNRNIHLHTVSREFISHFPKDKKELSETWPQCLYKSEKSYITKYINICLLESSSGGAIIDCINELSFGCIFIPEQLKNNGVIKKLESSKLSKVYVKRDDSVTEKKYVKKLNEEFKITNKTTIEPINIPRKNYLIPLEIVINRNRGIYTTLFNNIQETEVSIAFTKEDLDRMEKKAMEDVKCYLKRLIVEKYIINLSMNEEGKSYLEEVIQDKINSSYEDELLLYKLENSFLKLSDYFFENMDKVNYRTDMVFVIPMVNKTTVEMVNKILKIKQKKNVLKQMYNFSGYYRQTSGEFPSVFILENKIENRILDTLVVNFALGKRIPFVRLPNLPAEEIIKNYSYMFNNVIRNSDFKEIKKFNKYTNIISKEMKKSLDDDLIELIIKNGNHIKFITDAPIEWIKYKNAPLGIVKSISRLPILPGNILVHSAQDFKEIKIRKSEVSFLIINTLSPDDILFKDGKKLGELMKNYFPNNVVEYFEITNKKEFIDKFKMYDVTFFIYYGHGSMPETKRDNSNQIGKLHVGNDTIDMLELEEKLSHTPKITILGACQTQVVNSHYLNIGNMFLGKGSKSVLATYFPVDGNYTYFLIKSIFKNLRDYFSGNTPKYMRCWADIILQARRNLYLIEPLITIVNRLKKEKINYTIDEEKILEFLIKRTFELSEQVAENYFECIESLPLFRENVYLEYFEQEDDNVKKCVKNIFENYYTFPESIIFTSLGSPEVIDFI